MGMGRGCLLELERRWKGGLKDWRAHCERLKNLPTADRENDALRI